MLNCRAHATISRILLFGCPCILILGCRVILLPSALTVIITAVEIPVGPCEPLELFFSENFVAESTEIGIAGFLRVELRFHRDLVVGIHELRDHIALV